MGDWLEMYAKVMELDYWGSTEALTAQLRRGGEGMDRHGPAGRRDGDAPCRSSSSSPPAPTDRRNVHDSRAPDVFTRRAVSLEPAYRAASAVRRQALRRGRRQQLGPRHLRRPLGERARDVTMIQRSPTTVVRSETLMELGFDDLYSEEAVAARHHHRESRPDLRLDAVPAAAGARSRPSTEEIGATRCRLLRPAGGGGFRSDFGEDGSGLLMKALPHRLGLLSSTSAARS